MAKIKIASGDATVNANQADATYILAKGVTLNAATSGILGTGSSEGVRFVLDGRITANDGDGLQWGIELWGGKATSVDIGKSGRITADHAAGVRLFGDDHHVDNAGRISAYLGISVDGVDNTVVNTGTILAPGIGINVLGDATIVNSGMIQSDKVGIFLTQEAMATGSTIRNSGEILANTATLGTALGEKVVNSGEIVGRILLGGGADTFVFKAGSVTDMSVEGNFGDDKYIVSTRQAQIAEKVGEGFDLVKSTISYTLSDHIEQINLLGKANIRATGNDQDNHVQGNAGKNVLRGEGGVDFLLGMGGNDRLFGGEGDDYFSFLKGSGRDTIMDFEIGHDEIQLGNLKGAIGFDNMIAKHTAQKGDDVWITYGKDVVILRNIDADQLQAADFNFG